MPVQTQTVQGHVYQLDGSSQVSLVGATVRVVDWDKAGEDLLCETQTDENGYYQCQYDPAQYRSSAAEDGGAGFHSVEEARYAITGTEFIPGRQW